MPMFGVIKLRHAGDTAPGQTANEIKELIELDDSAALKKWLIENPSYEGPIYRLEAVKARIELIVDRQPIMR